MSLGHVTQAIRRSDALLLTVVLALVISAAFACTIESTNDTTEEDTGGTTSMTGGSAVTSLDRSTEGIWVTGTGRVSIEPDIATVRLGVEATRDTVSEALSEAAQSMQTIVYTLTAAGIDEKDIRTLNFTVAPQYKWSDELGRSETIGYIVRNTVRAIVRDLDSLEDVIDEAIRAGGDDARFDDLSFGVDDRADAEREARDLAMAAALEQATQLASSAGVSLGDPFYVAESAAPIAQNISEMARSLLAYGDSASAGTPILSGEQDIVIYVRIGYEMT